MNDFNLTKKSGRIAGVWYLLFIIFCLLSELGADSSNQQISRLAVICTLAGYVCFLLLGNTLYQMFQSVNQNWTRLMALFIVVGISIEISAQSEDKVFAGIFWGLWLLPLAFLIMKSSIVPNIIGILLIIGCICQLADFAVIYFFSGNATFILPIVYAGEMIAEFSFVLWLLIKGADVRGIEKLTQC